MTEEMHRFLYNRGITLLSNSPIGNHFCPDKKTFEYIHYCWDEGKSYEMKMRKADGDCAVLPSINPIMCQESYGKAHNCVRMREEKSDIDSKRKFENMFGNWQHPKIAKLIVLISCEKTKVFVGYKSKRLILMSNFLDAFDIHRFEEHLINLLCCLLESVIEHRDFMKILRNIETLFDDLKWIFDNRDLIIDQIWQYYMETMVEFESGKYGFHDGVMAAEIAYGPIKEKKKVNDFKAFLSYDKFGQKCDGEMILVCNIITILSSFLKQCFDQYKEPAVFGSFIQATLDIQTIKGLGKVDLGSEKSKIANAKLILRYLKKILRNHNFKLYQKIA